MTTQIFFDSDSPDLAAYLAANPQIRPRHITVIGSQTMIEPDAPPVVKAVTMRQAREALIRRGMVGMVEQAIAAVPDPVERAIAQNAWEYSQQVQTANPFVVALIDQTPLTLEDVYDLFEYAAGL